MELEVFKVFGLPAHALVVHLAVVVVPLAALATVSSVLVVRWRPRLTAVAVALSAVALAVVWVASGSGEALEEHVDRAELIEEHTELGETMLPIAGGLLAGAAAVAVVDRWRRRGRALPAGVVAVAMLLGLASSGVATVQVIRTGHSGSRAVWDGELDEDEGRSGPGDGEYGR
jgi:hypothetical protein